MKKRLAAVAAMSLAMFQGLSVAGMLPAQAAAPVVAHDDCYVTAGTLFALGSNSDIIEGLTGTLALDANGRVQRTLEWARIDDGLPKPLDDKP